MEQHVELELSVRGYDCLVHVYEIQCGTTRFIEIRNRRNEKISDRLFNLLMGVYEYEITEGLIEANR